MAPETRQRILAVARRLGYTPHPAAAALRSGRSYAVGLLFTRRGQHPTLAPVVAGTGDFVLNAAQAVERLLREAGYHTQLLFTEPAGTGSRQALDLERVSRLDGLLLLGGSYDDVFVLHLADAVPATVLVGSRLATPVVDSFHPDYVYGTYLATRHLLALGRWPVALLNGPSVTHSSADKLAGYRRALDEAGRPLDPELVVAATGFGVEAGRHAAATLLGRRPHLGGCVTGHDTLALGLVQMASRHGRRCPADLAVTGFYDTSVALLSDPPLTSVRTYPTTVGELAAERLLRRIAEPDLIPVQVTLTPSLAVRGSTGSTGSHHAQQEQRL